MSWISAAERLSAIDRKAVVFDSDRCLHSIDRFVECEACFRICPVDAIKPGQPPVFDDVACRTCLACLPVCPTGSYSAEDAVPSLMKCALRMEATSLELGCEAHPKLETGPVNVEVALRVPGCLAGLGLGGLLTLFALGKEQVFLRLDACRDCPWEMLQEAILGQVEQAKNVLGLWGMADRLVVLDEQDEIKTPERPVWEVDNPPLSRRDLFRFAAERSQLLAARMINANSGKKAERRPSPDRLRLIAAIAQLPEFQVELHDFPNLATITISEACTACGVCARVCPTQAIRLKMVEGKTFSLNFLPDQCIGCGVCQQVCFPEAIEINHRPDFNEIFASEEVRVLREGDLERCHRCNTLTAKGRESHLCPLCEYRRANPFSGQLPPRLLQILQSQAKIEKKP